MTGATELPPMEKKATQKTEAGGTRKKQQALGVPIMMQDALR